MASPYRSKCVSFATKHHKEDAIAPHFQEYLNATLIVPLIDTDQLGTFSGEIERHGNALEVAERKARLGMESNGLPYGLASEGSFGPHPFIPFLPCDNELMLFIDTERGFKLHEVMLSTETNYNHACASGLEEVQDFLRHAKFPSHAVIVRPNQWDDKSLIFKGIQNQKELEPAFATARQASVDGKVWLETDMRAHVNPSRMNVIGTLAQRLAKRLATPCPRCASPGWGRVRVEKGLHCEYCDQQTEMIAHEIHGCVLCCYTEILPRADGLKAAPQTHCGWCNP